MEPERNSERQSQWVGVAIGVAVILLTVIDQLLGLGIIPKEHAAYGILGGLVTALGPIIKYQNTRGAVKVAKAIGAANPTQPPQP